MPKDQDDATEKAPEVKCDNHLDREGKTFTGDGAYEIHLCEECTPPWFKAE